MKYLYYYVAHKPHPNDNETPGVKVYHSTKSCRQIVSSLLWYCKPDNSFILSGIEFDALSKYYKNGLSYLFPTSSDKRVPIRLFMLAQVFDL